jgi:hypothetical protein
MNIDEALILMESTVEEDINGLTPKDRLLFWANLLEFKKAKIQRIPFEPVDSGAAKIIIQYADNIDYNTRGFFRAFGRPKRGLTLLGAGPGVLRPGQSSKR